MAFRDPGPQGQPGRTRDPAACCGSRVPRWLLFLGRAHRPFGPAIALSPDLSLPICERRGLVQALRMPVDCLSILCKAGENGRDSKGRPTIAVSFSTTGAIAQRPYRSWERKGASCSPRAGRAQTHCSHPPGLFTRQGAHLPWRRAQARQGGPGLECCPSSPLPPSPPRQLVSRSTPGGS